MDGVAQLDSHLIKLITYVNVYQVYQHLSKFIVVREIHNPDVSSIPFKEYNPSSKKFYSLLPSKYNGSNGSYNWGAMLPIQSLGKWDSCYNSLNP